MELDIYSLPTEVDVTILKRIVDIFPAEDLNDLADYYFDTTQYSIFEWLDKSTTKNLRTTSKVLLLKLIGFNVNPVYIINGTKPIYLDPKIGNSLIRDCTPKNYTEEEITTILTEVTGNRITLNQSDTQQEDIHTVYDPIYEVRVFKECYIVDKLYALFSPKKQSMLEIANQILGKTYTNDTEAQEAIYKNLKSVIKEKYMGSVLSYAFQLLKLSPEILSNDIHTENIRDPQYQDDFINNDFFMTEHRKVYEVLKILANATTMTAVCSFLKYRKHTDLKTDIIQGNCSVNDLSPDLISHLKQANVSMSTFKTVANNLFDDGNANEESNENDTTDIDTVDDAGDITIVEDDTVDVSTDTVTENTPISTIKDTTDTYTDIADDDDDTAYEEIESGITVSDRPAQIGVPEGTSMIPFNECLKRAFKLYGILFSNKDVDRITDGICMMLDRTTTWNGIVAEYMHTVVYPTLANIRSYTRIVEITQDDVKMAMYAILDILKRKYPTHTLKKSVRYTYLSRYCDIAKYSIKNTAPHLTPYIQYVVVGEFVDYDTLDDFTANIGDITNSSLYITWFTTHISTIAETGFKNDHPTHQEDIIRKLDVILDKLSKPKELPKDADGRTSLHLYTVEELLRELKNRLPQGACITLPLK